MQPLCNMDIDGLEIKTGDIKVDSEELIMLFKCLHTYHSVLCSSLEILSEQERKDLEKGIAITEYMQNKYILLGHLRNEQRRKYDMLKEVNSEDFKEGRTPGEIERAKDKAYKAYTVAKRQREKVQKEVDEIRNSILNI